MARLRFDRDYYAMLGVSVKATDDDIRRAYRRLALEFHPDRNPGNAAAEERFKEISEAYAVLIDPAKRRQYDRARQTGVPGDFTVNRDDLFRDLFADPRASAIFEELARELGRMGLHVGHRHFEQTLFGGRTVVSGHVVVISPFTPITMFFRLARAAPAWRARSCRRGRPLAARPPALGGLERLRRRRPGGPHGGRGRAGWQEARRARRRERVRDRARHDPGRRARGRAIEIAGQGPAPGRRRTR